MTTKANPALMAHLMGRRSFPAKRLGAPYPDRATLEGMLAAAARTPDHGNLAPWRFVVLGSAACARMADLMEKIGTTEARDPDKLARQAGLYARAGCIVAVIFAPDTEAKITRLEQEMSAAALCMNLLHAADAAGFGAQWLTGWMATHEALGARALGLASDETVAGFIHIGTPDGDMPDRPRPDAQAITTWLDA